MKLRPELCEPDSTRHNLHLTEDFEILSRVKLYFEYCFLRVFEVVKFDQNGIVKEVVDT